MRIWCGRDGNTRNLNGVPYRDSGSILERRTAQLEAVEEKEAQHADDLLQHFNGAHELAFSSVLHEAGSRFQHNRDSPLNLNGAN